MTCVSMRKPTVTDPGDHGARVFASAEMAGNLDRLSRSVARYHPVWARLRQRTHVDGQGYQDDPFYTDMEGSHGRRHRRPIPQVHREVPRVALIRHLRQRLPVHVRLLGTDVLSL